MSDYKTILSTAVRGLSEVRLYAETLDQISEEHPEVRVDLPSVALGIERAVAFPTRVERSYGNSYVFVDETTTNSAGDPLRVPVKVVAGGSGRVKTAFFASTQRTRDIVWRRSDV